MDDATYPWGMDPEMLTDDDVERLTDPSGTVSEAVREYVGDGEGMDDTVMRLFTDEIRFSVVSDAVEFASAGRCPAREPGAECYRRAGHSGSHSCDSESLGGLESFWAMVALGEYHPKMIAVGALREFAGLIVTRRCLADRDKATITTDEFVAEVNEYADVIEDRVRTYLRSRHPSGVALTFTSKGADSLRKFASGFEYMHPGEVFSPIQLEEVVQREAKNLGDR